MRKRNSTLKWGLRFIPLLLAVLLLSFVSYAQLPIKIDGDPSDWPSALGGLYPFAFVHDANNTNDDSFHSGIDQDLISGWSWVNGNTNDKGDISNAAAVLIHDTIFFMGDRTAPNGDCNIGFWLFLGGVAKGPVLASTPYDFVGTHVVGDLFVQCDFTGGGGVATVEVYEWVGSGGSDGTLNLLTTGITAGAMSNATNMAVPTGVTGWTYTPKSGTGYAANTFYEGYIHLNTEGGTLESICFSSFLLETRNSQSLNASRQDFAGGSFQIAPDVPVTVGDDICAPGGTVNLSASGGAGDTLKWYRDAQLTEPPLVGVTTDYSTTVTQTTTWWVTATNALGCTTTPATVTATVLPSPVCSITGTLSVCPHGDFTYSGPASMSSYLWSIIAGSATIPGANNIVNVTVHSNPTCGSFTLQLVITDANGCTSTCTQIVAVVDTQKPVITAIGTPANGVLGCNPSSAVINAALGTATATDNCDGTLTPTFGDSSVTGDCNKSQTRTWNVTDACGNTATPVTRTVTWKVDLVKPVIIASGTTLALGCNPSSADINAALGTATATDNCDGTLTPTFGDSSVTGTDCNKSQTRTWNVTDACGNTATPVTRTVTWKTDLVKPVIVASGTPSNGVLGCNPSSAVITAALGTATATDNCDGTLTPTFNDSAVTGTDCNKSQTRTWNVTDACGNAATPVTRTVTWKTDLVKPVIVASGTPSNGVLGCNPSSADINAALGTATATDNCDGTLTPTFGDSSVTGTDCNKSQTRTWNVTDACGNAATPVTRTVTWKTDLVKPVIVASGTTLTLGCNPSSAVINAALGTATATDNCDGTLTPTFGDSSVTGTDCNKSQTRTWNVTDACGNAATPVTRTVTWKTDLVKPVIVASGTTLTLGCNPSSATINAALGTATATDNCDGTLTPTAGDSSVTGTACNKSQTRTWNVTDACGNTATPVTRTVTWKVDLTPPALQVPLTDLVFECWGPVIIPTPSFVDNCDGAVSYTCAVTGAPGANCSTYTYPIGDTQVCFTAVDGCGNTASVCIKVTVKPCPQNCTYTQGFYGNQKGKACDLTSTPVPGTVFTAALLAEGPLVIGAGSNTITFMPGDAPLLQAILPGGGGSYVLTGACDPPVWDPDNVDFGCLDPYLTDRQHRLNNTLLAQTITLGLNLRIGSNSLGGIPLQSGKWLVTQDKKSCAISSGLVDPVCSAVYSTVTPTLIDCYKLTVDPYHYYKLDAGVICYMSTKGYAMTIQGLFNLANDALGGVRTFPADVNCGTGTSTVTLSDIAGAVDLINNIFDECKGFVGYWTDKYTCANACQAKSAIITVEQPGSLSVYPNPFSQSVTFEFVPGKDAHASLDIYNMLGQKVQTLLSKQVEQGTTYTVEFQPTNMVPGVLIYKLVLDNDVQTGKVIYNK